MGGPAWQIPDHGFGSRVGAGWLISVAHLNDDFHEDGVVVEIRATVPEGFTRGTDSLGRGDDFIRVAMIRLATI